MKDQNSKKAGSSMTSKKIFSLIAVMCSVFFFYQADAQEKNDTCTDGRLNSAQIRALVTNKKAKGIPLNSRNKDTWEEIQYRDGTAKFINKDGRESKGLWKVEADQICWCYDKYEDWGCKIIEASDNCSVWYYIDPDNGYKWQEYLIFQIYSYSGGAFSVILHRDAGFQAMHSNRRESV